MEACEDKCMRGYMKGWMTECKSTSYERQGEAHLMCRKGYMEGWVTEGVTGSCENMPT